MKRPRPSLQIDLGEQAPPPSRAAIYAQCRELAPNYKVGVDYAFHRDGEPITYGGVCDETAVAVYDRATGRLSVVERVQHDAGYSELEIRIISQMERETPQIAVKARNLIKEQRDVAKKHEMARLGVPIRTCPHFNKPIDCVACARYQTWIPF